MEYTGIVAGVDEVGRGPLAGPVVAACVILDRQKILPDGIDDSKKLLKARREALYSHLMAEAHVGIGICSVEEIDEHNILGASKLAMRRAFELLPLRPDVVLVDGNQLPDLPCDMHGIIGGDALCVSIAAASIIAKVTRDRIMEELAKEYPHYGWQHNAGYGTKLHHEGLAMFGITPHHRRSFAPIRQIVEMMQAQKVAG
ncbi:MAG TPA: ribonuclease HII [Rickettsiales bacterium]|nr:ribonuclease HII [Rickettsiales bacterium]